MFDSEYYSIMMCSLCILFLWKALCIYSTITSNQCIRVHTVHTVHRHIIQDHSAHHAPPVAAVLVSL